MQIGMAAEQSSSAMLSTEKQCSNCRAVKNRAEFYKDRTQADGLDYDCAECTRADAKAYRKKYPERLAKIVRTSKLKRAYGLTLDEYDKKLRDQGGVCAICLKSKASLSNKFHVDHCHDSGNLRGILCGSCNVALGHFRDSPEILRRAISYLKRYGNEN